MWTAEAAAGLWRAGVRQVPGRFCSTFTARCVAWLSNPAGRFPGCPERVQKCRRRTRWRRDRAPTSHYALRELLYYTVRELLLTVYS